MDRLDRRARQEHVVTLDNPTRQELMDIQDYLDTRDFQDRKDRKDHAGLTYEALRLAAESETLMDVSGK